MVAPGSGSPVAASVTRPCIWPVWASAGDSAKQRRLIKSRPWRMLQFSFNRDMARRGLRVQCGKERRQIRPLFAGAVQGEHGTVFTMKGGYIVCQLYGLDFIPRQGLPIA